MRIAIRIAVVGETAVGVDGNWRVEREAVCPFSIVAPIVIDLSVNKDIVGAEIIDDLIVIETAIGERVMRRSLIAIGNFFFTKTRLIKGV